MRASGTAPDFGRLPSQASALARFHFHPALPVQSQVTEKPPFAKLAEPARTAPTEVSFGPFRLLPTQFLVLEGDKSVPLGSRALEILIALVERAGELVSKQELTDRVWPNVFVGPANLTVHISALRRALRTKAGIGSSSAILPRIQFRWLCRRVASAEGAACDCEPAAPSLKAHADPGISRWWARNIRAVHSSLFFDDRDRPWTRSSGHTITKISPIFGHAVGFRPHV
jgi:hypothetical protein